jgi:hypothetical protein
MNYLIERARERSTWAGLIAVLSGVGIGIRPELADSIVAIGVAVGGLLFALTRDAPKG